MLRSFAKVARRALHSNPLAHTPRSVAMARVDPPVPAPSISRLDAAESPIGLARRNVSSAPPGNRNPSPHSASATPIRALGQSGSSSSGSGMSGASNGGSAANGTFAAEACHPSSFRMLSSSIPPHLRAHHAFACKDMAERLRKR